MIRNIKIARKRQVSKNVPAINLQGVYLREHGFEIGDQVRIELFRDEIRIKRMTPEMILKAMTERNPSLRKLVAEFDCVACG